MKKARCTFPLRPCLFFSTTKEVLECLDASHRYLNSFDQNFFHLLYKKNNIRVLCAYLVCAVWRCPPKSNIGTLPIHSSTPVPYVHALSPLTLHRSSCPTPDTRLRACIRPVRNCTFASKCRLGDARARESAHQSLFSEYQGTGTG